MKGSDSLQGVAARCRSQSMGGFGYVGVLILLGILSVTATATLQLGILMERRAAEEELLRIGTEFHSALASYAASTPPGQSPRPRSLQDLLRDPRYPGIRRHLRRIYTDPLTGKTEWGTEERPDMPGIVAIYSLSTNAPIKVGNFAVEFAHFEHKKTYSEWKFSVF